MVGIQDTVCLATYGTLGFSGHRHSASVTCAEVLLLQAMPWRSRFATALARELTCWGQIITMWAFGELPCRPFAGVSVRTLDRTRSWHVVWARVSLGPHCSSGAALFWRGLMQTGTVKSYNPHKGDLLARSNDHTC